LIKILCFSIESSLLVPIFLNVVAVFSFAIITHSLLFSSFHSLFLLCTEMERMALRMQQQHVWEKEHVVNYVLNDVLTKTMDTTNRDQRTQLEELEVENLNLREQVRQYGHISKDADNEVRVSSLKRKDASKRLLISTLPMVLFDHCFDHILPLV